MCSNIAMSVLNALTVLRGNLEDAEAAALVADSLDRIGWMADQAAAIAGETVPVAGDADGWFLDGVLRKRLGAARTSAATSTPR